MVEAFDAALLDALEDDSPPRVAQAELAPPEPPPEPLAHLWPHGTAVLLWLRDHQEGEGAGGGPYKFADIAMQLTPVEVVRFIRGNMLLDLLRLLKLCVPTRDRHGRWRSSLVEWMRINSDEIESEIEELEELASVDSAEAPAAEAPPAEPVADDDRSLPTTG